MLACSRRRGIGKAGGSIKGGRIDLQEMVGMGQFENAINHSACAGDAERAPGIFQAGKAIHNFSQTTTIELGHMRKVEDHARLTLLEKCIESQFQLLALRAHLKRTRQLKNNDPWFQFFLNDVQGGLSVSHQDSNGDDGKFSTAIGRVREWAHALRGLDAAGISSAS